MLKKTTRMLLGQSRKHESLNRKQRRSLAKDYRNERKGFDHKSLRHIKLGEIARRNFKH